MDIMHTQDTGSVQMMHFSMSLNQDTSLFKILLLGPKTVCIRGFHCRAKYTIRLKICEETSSCLFLMVAMQLGSELGQLRLHHDGQEQEQPVWCGYLCQLPHLMRRPAVWPASKTLLQDSLKSLHISCTHTWICYNYLLASYV